MPSSADQPHANSSPEALEGLSHFVLKIDRQEFRNYWLKAIPEGGGYEWSDQESERFLFANGALARAASNLHGGHALPLIGATTGPASDPPPPPARSQPSPHHHHHSPRGRRPEPGEIKLFGYGLDD